MSTLSTNRSAWRWRHSPTGRSMTAWFRSYHSFLTLRVSSATFEIMIRAVSGLFVFTEMVYIPMYQWSSYYSSISVDLKTCGLWLKSNTTSGRSRQGTSHMYTKTASQQSLMTVRKLLRLCHWQLHPMKAYITKFYVCVAGITRGRITDVVYRCRDYLTQYFNMGDLQFRTHDPLLSSTRL